MRLLLNYLVALIPGKPKKYFPIPIDSILFFFLLSFVIFFSGCKKNPAPYQKPDAQISLTVEDVTCTEAWLRLQIDIILEMTFLSLSNVHNLQNTSFTIPSFASLETGLINQIIQTGKTQDYLTLIQ
ncbi:MAG: hypothetical protein WAN36_06910 [Calditrichia bacterium]